MIRFARRFLLTPCGSSICLLLAVVASTTAALAEPPLIPREVLFGNPDRALVTVSPDGSQLAFLAAHNGVMNVWVQPIGQADARPVTLATERPIRWYTWAANSEQIIYRQDRGGDENFHLYAFDLKTAQEVDLTPFEAVQARLTAADPDIPDEILVSVNNRDPKVHDVWRVNTRTGKGEMTFENTRGYADVMADSQFVIRVATRMNNRTGGLECHARDSADGPWYELGTWGLEDAAVSGPIGISRDGRTIYLVDSRHVNTGRLYAYTLGDNNEPTYSALASNDKADLDEVLFHPSTGKPQAVAFEYDRTDWQILDPSITVDWNFLKKAGEGEMKLASRDRADQRWVVSYIRDNGPVSFYLFDRPTRKATFLFNNRSQLEGLKLASMKPTIIRARDGLDLVCYLTTPADGKRRNLPMVLLVHGGPWARDSWGFNPIHQWLASRGYAVLSVNFRGSTGFGKNHLNSGNREWAGKMHDDLIDAVNWAVTEKIADPDRVAIMGGSYGGYATLVGLTFTPKFFACGVDIVGPSHVRTLLETIPPYWEPIKAMFEQRVGALSEPDLLDRISPLTKVDQIQRPLLIGQGRNDPRVKESESVQIVNAMQAKQLPVTYVVFPDEGHGFARPQNNMAFFAITEAFLSQHLGGSFEPMGSSIRQSTAEVQAGAELVPGLNEAVGP